MVEFKKRGDIIAEQIKEWVASSGMMPGHKLPSESALTQIFGIGKSSIREALKSLEVQGMIRTTTGQGGGSFLMEVSETHTIGLLQNYFYFKKLTPEQLYEVRRMTEPQLAAHVAQIADADIIAKLEEKVELCRPVARTRQEWQLQLQHHVDFHDVLANCASNPLLCFNCKFVNSVLRNVVRRRESSAQKELIRNNFRAHEQLLKAIRARDAREAEQVMRKHIEKIESYFPTLKMTIERRFFSHATNRTPPAWPEVEP